MMYQGSIKKDVMERNETTTDYLIEMIGGGTQKGNGFVFRLMRDSTRNRRRLATKIFGLNGNLCKKGGKKRNQNEKRIGLGL